MKGRRCAGACHAGAYAPAFVVWCSPFSFLREAIDCCEAQVAAAQGKRTPGWRASRAGAKCAAHRCPRQDPGRRCCFYEYVFSFRNFLCRIPGEYEEYCEVPHGMACRCAGVARRGRVAVGSKPGGLNSWVDRLVGRRASYLLEGCWGRRDPVVQAVGCVRSAGPWRSGTGSGTRGSPIVLEDGVRREVV